LWEIPAVITLVGTQMPFSFKDWAFHPHTKMKNQVIISIVKLHDEM
jgi:hypothetical protein